MQYHDTTEIQNTELQGINVINTKRFTKNQMDIINTINGPVLVVACPGSGKTTTVISRTHRLIESGVNPKNILVITFTKTAASEMGKRFNETYHRKDVEFCTIHSFCYKVLKTSSAYYDSIPLVGSQQKAIIDKIIKERYHIEDQYKRADTVKDIISCISAVMNSDGTFDDPKYELIRENKKIQIGAVYEEYKAFKEQNNYIDFDDMLIACRKIFLEEPQVLSEWQKRAQYIIIDEYQDTNIIQSHIFNLLAREHRNICVVGDDDQSIYMFRAANPKIMLGFGYDFPDYKQFYLDTNYRSDPKIIEHANLLIKNNIYRYDKEFKSGSKDPRKCIISRKDYRKEYQFDGNLFSDNTYKKMLNDLKKDIDELYDMGIPYEEMAILYRVNKQAQPIMHFLEKEKIPFHTLKEDGVRDIHTEFFFRCIMDYYYYLKNSNKECFKNIVNTPNRYIPFNIINQSDTTEEGMIAACKNHYLKDPQKGKKCQDRISLFFYTLEKLKRKTKPIDFVNLLYDYCDSDFREWALKEAQKNNGMDYTEDMLNNCLKAIQDEAKEYETMEEWIAAANQNMENVTVKLSSEEGIVLSTYHSSKGLEWDGVFLIDANEGVTPSPLVKNQDEEEEERRMFYVAFTRARKHERIYVTDNPSPFLYEMNIEKGYYYDSEQIKEEEKEVNEIKKTEPIKQKIESSYRNNPYKEKDRRNKKEKGITTKGIIKQKPKAKLKIKS